MCPFRLLSNPEAGAKAFADDPDECRHSVRIFHGCEKCGLEVPIKAERFIKVAKVLI